MLAQERQDKILQIAEKNKIVKVSELSQLMNATEATIRRDLDELQKKKKVLRIHGGAILSKSASRDMTENELSVRCLNAKRTIAKKAYEFIDDNDAIIIDSSTTCLELVKLLKEGGKKHLSVITNSFRIIPILNERPDFQVIHTGGQVKASLNSSYGSIAAKMLKEIKVDKCFIGTSGIDLEYGYSDPNLEDYSLKAQMLKTAKQKFVLADHTKFNDSYIGKFADFTGTIDYLITDFLPDSVDRERVEASVNLIVAEEK